MVSRSNQSLVCVISALEVDEQSGNMQQEVRGQQQENKAGCG